MEFIQPDSENIFCKIKNIYDDKTQEKLKSAHGGQERMVYIEISKTPEVSSVMRKKIKKMVFTGDRIEFIQPKGDNIFCKIKNIYDDKTFEKLKSAHGGQERMVYIEINKKPEVFSVMRKKKNKK